MNVELLLKVKKHILQKPSRLRMSHWICSITRLDITNVIPNVVGKKFVFPRIYASSNDINHTWGESDSQKIPDCGTVGCIAGWTVLLTPEDEVKEINELSYVHVKSVALKLLRLNDHSNELFMVSSWPTEFKNRYYEAKNQKTRAKIVGEVIDDFIRRYND